MNPSDYFRVFATLVEAVSQVIKIKADGIVTDQEALETALLLAEKSEIDTLILARADSTRSLEAASQLIARMHEMLAKEGEITLGDALRAALAIAQDTGTVNQPLSRTY